METAEIKMYSDYKSPFAYLAFEPALALSERYRVRVRWIPFQLRIKSQGKRSIYSEYKVAYSYMDARRWAKPRGIEIHGPLKVYDTTPALIGGLFADRHGRLLEYSRELYHRFFLRQFEPDNADAVAELIGSVGLAPDQYRAYLDGDGVRDYERAQEEASADHVFGVPLFLFEKEQFWGYDRMPILEQRLTEAGLAITH